jgi:hypothetical protein
MRQLRGVLVLAILWAVTWAPIGLLLGVYRQARASSVGDVPPPPPGFVTDIVARYTLSLALMGAIAGGSFAVIVALAERQRMFGDLTWKRFALLGVLGAAVLPALAFVLVAIFFPGGHLSVQVLPLIALLALGALSAAGTLGLARRGRSAGDVAA